MQISEETKYRILEILVTDTKTWTWYTLDRAFSFKGYHDFGNLATIASHLAKEGLLNIHPGETNMDKYTITEKGRAYLHNTNQSL